MEQEELEQALQKLESFANSDPEEIRKKVWSSMSILADLILRAKDANFESGWAAKVVDHEGNPIFSSEECQGLEATLLTYMKPMFHGEQQGGGPLSALATGKASGPVVPPPVPPAGASAATNPSKKPCDTVKKDDKDEYIKCLEEQLNKSWSMKGKEFAGKKAENLKKLSTAEGREKAYENAKAAAKAKLAGFSIDAAYFKTKKAMSEMDEYALGFTKKEGPFKLFHPESEESITIPLPPQLGGPRPVPHKAVSLIITLVVEVIRLMVSFGPLQSGVTRVITSIVLGGINILQGDWKGAILSSMGIVGPVALTMGVIGKLILYGIARIDPASLDGSLLYTFKSAKSFPIGMCIWLLGIFATDSVRKQINEKFIPINEIIDSQIETLKAKGGNTDKYDTLITEFNGLKPSFANLIAIQSIANHPAITCSTDFVKAINDVTKYNKDKDGPTDEKMFVRLFVELCNIPLTDEMRQSVCENGIELALEESIAKYIKERVGESGTSEKSETS